MKKIGKILGLLFLGLVLLVMIKVLPQAILESSYDSIMQNLDKSSASGKLIAGYEEQEGVYTIQYVPRDLLAKNAKKVGYILNISRGTTSQKYSGGGYAVFSIYGETIDAKLIDCDTGNVIASEHFEAYFPEYAELGETLTIDPSEVSDWVTQVYQQKITGKQTNSNTNKQEHVWADATCTAPKTCTVCGATEGKPLGHNFMPTVCTRCGMEAGGQKQEAPAQTKPAEEAPEDTLKSLIAGKWKLDMLLDANTFEYISYDGELTLQINKDFSAFFSTPEGKHNYDWVFNYIDYEDNDPNKYIYYFLLIDEDGNEIICNYYYDGSVAVFTEDYSVFFVR